MAFSTLDWVIFLGMFVGLTSISFFLKRYAKGVAEFLVAGRHVGRYLGLESDSMTGLGAITILALWQMIYKSGFVGQFWYLLTPIAATVVALTGFGIYRFRQTRAMTLGQFMEMRYSKSTRILFGIIAFCAGILNMGVFPATGADFFVSYCGIQPEFMGVATSIWIMLVLGIAAVIICFNGGQVALVVTNFVQALFVNLMLVAIMIVIYRMFTWQQFAETYLAAENADHLLHPFSQKGSADFDKAFYLIGIFSMIYWVISWAPNTLITSSARDAHEAKMMRVMVEIKKLVYVGLGLGVLPLAVFVLMRHPDFADKAAAVQQTVDQIPNEQVRSQMLTPAALQYIMPRGILGGFAVFVLFAFMSTQTSYLLAWGGGLIQDVIIPARGRHLEPKKHMRIIRMAVLGVAVFIILFSIFFEQNEDLYMFLDLTGGLFLSSAIVLLGGLYWQRGTTAGAWAAMLAGTAVSLVGFFVRSRYETAMETHGQTITMYVFAGFGLVMVLLGMLHIRRRALVSGLLLAAFGLTAALLSLFGRDCLPLNLGGRIIMFHASLSSIAVYFIVSELTPSAAVDFGKMFNYSSEEIRLKAVRRWWQFAPEVPMSDRILIPCIYAGIGALVVFFVGAWVYNTFKPVAVDKWLDFWHVYVYVMFGFGFVFMVWVIVGGFRDLFRMFAGLRQQTTNADDDGRVESREAAGKQDQTRVQECLVQK
jgi:SSS family solute:Na+ symporter